MAHLHFKRTVYRSGGGTASKRLEYITRQPERDLVAADRQLRYLVRTGKTSCTKDRATFPPGLRAIHTRTFVQRNATSGRTGWPLRSGKSRSPMS